jgi:dihydroxyacetone kinase
VAAEARAVLDRNHDFMLKQMAAQHAKEAGDAEPGDGEHEALHARGRGGRPAQIASGR